VPWESFISPGRAVRFRVTCRKSRLYHSDAVAERLATSIDKRVGGAGAVTTVSPTDEAELEDENDPDAQLVVVRFLHDQCTISADASGALLHLRGYRQAVAKAPLRETLAAAMLIASRWDARAPLLDPMCGSGTIPIEGAMLGRRIPPGLNRTFSFMRWPDFSESTWTDLVDAARGQILPSSPAEIQGSDHMFGAVMAATSNAQRAGVYGDVELRGSGLNAISPPAGPGWIVTNPPYGLRVGGEAAQLLGLYSQLGTTLRAKAPRWTLAMLSVDTELERAVGVPFEEAFKTSNGGIPVRLVVGELG
jgi:putative N6-adenine-specific DNA methylase